MSGQKFHGAQRKMRNYPLNILGEVITVLVKQFFVVFFFFYNVVQSVHKAGGK